MREFQFQMHDFVREIEKFDLYLSDNLTFALCIWVGIFTSYVYISPHDGLLFQAPMSSVAYRNQSNIYEHFGAAVAAGSERTLQKSKQQHQAGQLQSMMTNQHDVGANAWVSLTTLGPPLVQLMSVLLALLTLHRCCCKTYPIMCTIAAYYQSQNKCSFVPILALFNERRTCYTLFRLNPFLPTTLLSLIGWSFSCFFIIRGIVKGQ